jgi:putative mRNA 3-end processing factor
VELARTPAGLYLPALDLHLDPRMPVARAFVSHAHGDHAGGAASGEVLASPETLALLGARARQGRTEDDDPKSGPVLATSARPIAWDGAVELPVLAAHGGGTARLSIARAGHVLGAAALIVDGPGGRTVYTGDTSRGAGKTYPAPDAVPCDILVIEATFALPIFRFPDEDATRSALGAFCRARLDAGRTPLLLVHALGKAQEVTSHLALAEGLPVTLHGAAYEIARAYEALGVPLGLANGSVHAYAGEPKGKGQKNARVVLAPARARSQMEKALKNADVALVSGFALLDAQLEQHRADAGFVLSDHADHDALCERVRASGAKHVVTVYGDAEPFAAILRGAGHDARAIDLEAIDAREGAGAEAGA